MKKYIYVEDDFLDKYDIYDLENENQKRIFRTKYGRIIKFENNKIVVERCEWIGEGNASDLKRYTISYKYIEFDNFEDLIEVGDLIVIEEQDMTISKTVHWVWKINQNFHTSLGRLTKGFTETEINKIEIYKHIGKDFIRVCHKVDGKWVID